MHIEPAVQMEEGKILEKWLKKVEVLVTLTFWLGLLKPPIHGILRQNARWVAYSFSMRSSQSGDQTRVSRAAGRFFTV